jgi:hypothetical protein
MVATSKAKVILVGALVVAAIAVPVWQQTRLRRVQSENTQLRAQGAELTALRAAVERQRATQAGPAELERLRQWQAQTQPELLRLRGMAGVARQANAEAEGLRTQLARQASEAGINPVSGPMADLMKDAMKLAMEQQVAGRLSSMTASLHLTPEQAQAVRDILTRQAQVTSAGVQQVFSGKYDKAELARFAKDGGNPEAQIKALLTPDQQASYQSYQQEEAAYNARLAANSELLQLQSTLGVTAEQQDRVLAALYDVNLSQLTSHTTQSFTNQAEAMQWVLEQKAKALGSVLTPTQLENYRQQQALQLKATQDILRKMEDAGGSK